MNNGTTNEGFAREINSRMRVIVTSEDNRCGEWVFVTIEALNRPSSRVRLIECDGYTRTPVRAEAAKVLEDLKKYEHSVRYFTAEEWSAYIDAKVFWSSLRFGE